jgi:hypothetical protein
LKLNGDIQWALFVLCKDYLQEKDINDKKVSRVNRNAKRRETSLKKKTMIKRILKSFIKNFIDVILVALLFCFLCAMILLYLSLLQ